MKMKRTIVAVVAAVALGASGAKKLIFVGWDTGDLTPAEGSARIEQQRRAAGITDPGMAARILALSGVDERTGD